MSQSASLENPEENKHFPDRAAPDAAFVIDQDLALVIERWPTLPDAIKSAMLAIVRSVEGDRADSDLGTKPGA